jgi:hypothetical protein
MLILPPPTPLVLMLKHASQSFIHRTIAEHVSTSTTVVTIKAGKCTSRSSWLCLNGQI